MSTGIVTPEDYVQVQTVNRYARWACFPTEEITVQCALHGPSFETVEYATLVITIKTEDKTHEFAHGMGEPRESCFLNLEILREILFEEDVACLGGIRMKDIFGPEAYPPSYESWDLFRVKTKSDCWSYFENPECQPSRDPGNERHPEEF